MNLEEMTDMTSTLIEDVGASYQRAEETGEQSDRRTFVRASFAYIEGYVFMMKHYMLDHAGTRPELFTREELAQLRGSRNVPRKHMVQNVEFTFDMFARVVGATDSHPLSSNEDSTETLWHLLAQANRVRNRIVHPTSLRALTITDEEMELVWAMCFTISASPPVALLIKYIVEKFAAWGERSERRD